MSEFFQGFIWGAVFGISLITGIVKWNVSDQKIITYPAEVMGRELWLICDLKGQHPVCQWSE